MCSRAYDCMRAMPMHAGTYRLLWHRPAQRGAAPAHGARSAGRLWTRDKSRIWPAAAYLEIAVGTWHDDDATAMAKHGSKNIRYTVYCMGVRYEGSARLR